MADSASIHLPFMNAVLKDIQKKNCKIRLKGNAQKSGLRPLLSLQVDDFKWGCSSHVFVDRVGRAHDEREEWKFELVCDSEGAKDVRGLQKGMVGVGVEENKVLRAKSFWHHTESVFSVALLERDSYFIHKRGRQINNRAIKHRLRILKTDMS